MNHNKHLTPCLTLHSQCFLQPQTRTRQSGDWTLIPHATRAGAARWASQRRGKPGTNCLVWNNLSAKPQLASPGQQTPSVQVTLLTVERWAICEGSAERSSPHQAAYLWEQDGFCPNGRWMALKVLRETFIITESFSPSCTWFRIMIIVQRDNLFIHVFG